MALSYAGVSLPQPTPMKDAKARRDMPCCGIFQKLFSQALGLTISTFTKAIPDPLPTLGCPPGIGTLYIPQGPLNFSRTMVLMTTDQLKAVTTATVVMGSGTSATLTMSDNTGTINTPMFMLTPIPFLPNEYLVPLVDKRYFWWAYSTGVGVLDTSTWTNLLNSILTIVGVTPSYNDTPPADFLTPPTGLIPDNTPIPIALDLALSALGMQMYTAVDGSVVIQLPSTGATAESELLSALGPTTLSGGDVNTDPTSGTNNLSSMVPANTTIVFPVDTGGTFAVTTSVSGLSLPQLTGIVGFGQNQVINLPYLTTAGNHAALTTLAAAYTKNFVLSKLASSNRTYGGLQTALTPAGLSPAISFTLRPDGSKSRTYSLPC